jgi:hypothetical protein
MNMNTMNTEIDMNNVLRNAHFDSLKNKGIILSPESPPLSPDHSSYYWSEDNNEEFAQPQHDIEQMALELEEETTTATPHRRLKISFVKKEEEDNEEEPKPKRFKVTFEGLTPTIIIKEEEDDDEEKKGKEVIFIDDNE